ncbi:MULTISPECIES: hypothetical protein [unclassified Duganella]|uniref:hypothetical protein n=1 Tax=unclassified Duganella TaxID=2636909 RepID=UPI0013EE9FA6|nr:MULTISPECIES: hypothetical protein [unclassified Duganella]
MQLKMKKAIARSTSEKDVAKSSLSTEFFSLMDQLNRDTKKSRAAAVKVMKKASAK